MDGLAYFHQVDVATLIYGVLFMMLWVGGRRSDSPRRGTGRPT
jgi:hypothetical protein